MNQSPTPPAPAVRLVIPALLAAAAASFVLPGAAQAYIGPGAGFALASSFFVVFVTALAGLALLLIWPFRMAWRAMTRRRPAKPLIRRLVVVGLDGQDPRVTDRLLAEGKLPNLAKLAEEGGYHRLATTYPSITPVAWSSFSTGTQPGKHNIFDFLDRDRRSYLPILSSVRIGSVDK
ncbi:MAG: alkaline phosphatase family protein, partial [Candidatus Eiseniibacteriota bacterium]